MGIIIYNVIRIALGSIPGRRVAKIQCKMKPIIRAGADTFLARPTSQCRRTESIVALESGPVCVANCKSFLVTEPERKHVRRRTRFQQHGDASCHQVFFPARQGTKGNSCHRDRNTRGTCTILCHRRKLGGPVEMWWYFHLCCASSWTNQNRDHPWTARQQVAYLPTTVQ